MEKSNKERVLIIAEALDEAVQALEKCLEMGYCGCHRIPSLVHKEMEHSNGRQ